MKKNINHINLVPQSEGYERRIELMHDVLDGGTFLPKTVLYKDIDEDFKRWVEEELRIVSDEGKEYPTMTLYSNQRFSEYAQSWEYTDMNNNLMLNFKTINRENNPQFGKIHNGLWNIPGDRFYLMKRQIVLDDNGTESYLDLKMKVPVAIDLVYKLSIFTTKYQAINDFNTMVNTKFAARQEYIKPNGHYMPMKLESISDESSYQIDDRQFYSQTYSITVMGYILQESDYRVEEVPMKRGLNMGAILRKKSKMPIVELDENPCSQENPYYYQPATITITFPSCSDKSEFKCDVNLKIVEIECQNIYNNYKIEIDDETVETNNEFEIKDGSVVKVKIYRRHAREDAVMILRGYNPDIVYDEREEFNDLPDVEEPSEHNLEVSEE